jgi:Uma2 family endonuclease
MITSIDQLDLNKTYSYADYLSWKFQERLELIKGKIFKMSPAPNVLHQSILTQLQGRIYNVLSDKPCKLFSAPFDVRLYDSKKSKRNEDVFTVVQPDLCVICDPNKLDEHGAIAAPELVIEILSPGNSKKEMKYKYDLYEEAGVFEYWIVDPSYKTVLVFLLENGKFIGQHPLIDEDKMVSKLFPELDFLVGDVFE